MNITQAVKLAIEKGGYKVEEITTPLSQCERDPVIKGRINIRGSNGYWDWFVLNDFILDPLFWQSLGKALGWDRRGETGEYNFERACYGYAHEYIDLILNSKDIDTFWEVELNITETRQLF
jgi:hypothetical protein